MVQLKISEETLEEIVKDYLARKFGIPADEALIVLSTSDYIHLQVEVTLKEKKES